MKNPLTALTIFYSVFAMGCAHGPQSHAVNSSAKSVEDVEVGVLDATPRQPTMAVTPFLPVNAPRHFTDIAHLTVQGRVSDEAVLINFLATKARQLGANGIIYGPVEQPFTHYPASATDQTLRIYRAEAIVFKADDQTQPSTGIKASGI